MSQDIVNEVYFFGGSVLMGIVITFVYDFILILRRVARHNSFFVSLEDLLFWITCAFGVFYMLYRENNGVLRWFAVCGAGLGMFLYKSLVGRHFVHLLSFLINKEIHIVRKIIGFVLRPLRFILRRAAGFFKCLGKKGKRIIRFLKKKLTIFLKMLRIALCKH